jgi:hypothetical protein
VVPVPGLQHLKSTRHAPVFYLRRALPFRCQRVAIVGKNIRAKIFVFHVCNRLCAPKTTDFAPALAWKSVLYFHAIARPAKQGFCHTSPGTWLVPLDCWTDTSSRILPLNCAGRVTLSSRVPSRRTAWRFFALWGGLALIPFGLAVYLTVKIVYVNHSEFDSRKTPVEEIGIYGPVPDPATPLNVVVNYVYDEGSKEASVEFAADIHGKIILNHVAGPDSCVIPGPDSDPTPIPLKISRIYKQGAEDDQAYLIAEHGGQPEYGWLRISCKLDSIVDRQTYTERRIHFHNILDVADYEPFDSGYLGQDPHSVPPMWGATLKWTLSLSKSSSIENVTFVGGTNVGNAYRDEREELKAQGGVKEFGATRDFAPDDLVEVHWESLTMRSWRDVLIVIIGTLVALGAAMFVESVRPLVDRFVADNEGTAHGAPPTMHAPATIPEPPVHTPPMTAPQSPSAQPKQSAPDAGSPSEPPRTPPKS